VRTLRSFRPDVIHLASPFGLGAFAGFVARRLRIPVVAVYQTDVPAFVSSYGLRRVARILWLWTSRIHSRAQLTLAPSSHSAADLERHGVDNVRIWRRGVDAERFAPTRRCEATHGQLADGAPLVVGYVGRLAPEKMLHHLAAVHALNGVRLVIVGDGPSRAQLADLLPRAHFTGFVGGDDLARIVASLDAFVHTGPHETFCQSIQEALASGVPVVAPASGGPLDLVHDGDNGFLYDPAHPEDVATHVATLRDDARLRVQLGRNARSGVEHRSWAALATEIVHHYRCARSNAEHRDELAGVA
jgi:phosphatidylinositol alpha 1,6-mannosyltransferase